MTSNDFDRSFELFEKNKDISFALNETNFDDSFDSAGYHFAATTLVSETCFDDESQLDRSMLFPNDPFQPSRDVEEIIRVAMHEQIAAMYDDFSQDGSITVTGSIYVKATMDVPFTLQLQDELLNLQRVEPYPGCQLVRDDLGNRILKVELTKSKLFREVCIADFLCIANLRPVPLVRYNFLLSRS